MTDNESELEDLVRQAIQATYPAGKLDDTEYVDVHYQQYDGDSHLLRARAPDHDLLMYERWLVVTVGDRQVHLRGDGQAGPTEFYVRARLAGE